MQSTFVFIARVSNEDQDKIYVLLNLHENINLVTQVQYHHCRGALMKTN